MPPSPGAYHHPRCGKYSEAWRYDAEDLFVARSEALAQVAELNFVAAVMSTPLTEAPHVTVMSDAARDLAAFAEPDGGELAVKQAAKRGFFNGLNARWLRHLGQWAPLVGG